MESRNKKIIAPEREAKIKEISQRLVKINIPPQLEVAVETLDFLNLIEDKEEIDFVHIERQQDLVSYLAGDQYAKDLLSVFEDKLTMLEDTHLDQYLSTLRYEEAVSNMNVHISAEIAGIQNKVLDLHLPKIQ